MNDVSIGSGWESLKSLSDKALLAEVARVTSARCATSSAVSTRCARLARGEDRTRARPHESSESARRSGDDLRGRVRRLDCRRAEKEAGRDGACAAEEAPRKTRASDECHAPRGIGSRWAGLRVRDRGWPALWSARVSRARSRAGERQGGGSEPANMRLLCHAHNQGEAERVYGKAHMERSRRRKRNGGVRERTSTRSSSLGPTRANADPRLRLAGRKLEASTERSARVSRSRRTRSGGVPFER